MSRMMKPENAVKRAKELLGVKAPVRALDVLYDVIRRGKIRNNCNEEVYEPILFLYLEICVDQKKSILAKEGLYQYRNMFQAINKGTLETVVRRYLELAEARTEEARKKSHDLVTADDLDQIETPEEALLKAVSGEGAQDRSDRTILTPWVKFLWESYRQCLELLRNNSRVEKLYHELARKAFDFCERYQRKTEFRKLCDILLNHLIHMQKSPTSATALSITNPETQQMNLETRLEQLNFAIRMELWQEAYRAIEYVSDLMGKSKKSPKPQIMAAYYQKLALVFWKAGNHLFHAAALLKLFHLNKEQKKNITSEEVSKKAAIVLTAALAIPLPSAHPEYDRFLETEKSATEKVAKLAALLNLPKAPTRISLFKELSKCGVIAAVGPEMANLYKTMEVTFDPLNVCKNVEKQLVWVSEQEDLQQYIPALQRMSITRLIKQCAQVYTTVTLDWLIKTAVFMDTFQLQRLVVDLVRHNDLQICMDHRNACVNFGSSLAESQREDIEEGPILQQMASESVRCHLNNMNRALVRCLAMIAPDAKKIEIAPARSKTIQSYHDAKNRDHQRILQRQHTIEHRKEKLENQTLEREESIRKAYEEQQNRQKTEEQDRLKREATEREKLRKEEQMKQIQTKQKLMQISQTSFGQKMIEKFDEEELLNLDTDEILQRHVEELEKGRKEHQQRLKTQEKRIDYMERAKRLYEIPKIVERSEKQKAKDKEYWQAEEEKRVKKLRDNFSASLAKSKRFHRMRADILAFNQKLSAGHALEHEKKKQDFEAKLDVERKNRLAERKEKRRQERRERYYREKQEEEQRQNDERLKKEREAKDAEEAAKRKEEEEEYARQQEDLDRQAKIREEREREVERKQQQGWRSADAKPKDSAEGIWRPSFKKTIDDEKQAVWRKKEVADPVDEPPTRKDRGLNRDIRLDEDFKAEQRLRDDDRPPVNDRIGDRLPNRDGDRPEIRRGDDSNRFGNRDGDRRGFDRDRGDRDFGRGDFGRDRDRDFGRGGDRDRDFGRGGDRDRDFGRGGDRDRGFSRGGDRDFGRGGDRDFGKGGDRDFGRGGDRDRGFGRGGDRDFGRGGDRDFGRGGDRDRDFGRGDRDRDFVRGGDRDRDFGRGGDRDRDFGRGGDRDFGRGGNRDRDFGRGGDRDRDFGRGGDRDRDFGRGGDRDRDFGRGGDRDRDFGRGGDRDRDFGRGGDRDRGFGPRDNRPRDGDREIRRADDANEWRRGPREEPKSKPPAKTEEPLRKTPAPKQNKPAADDDGWTTVRK